MKKPNIKNILVPIDFSTLSHQAIETAKSFARRFDAAVHLVFVHQFSNAGVFSSPLAPIPMPSPKLEDEAIAQEQRNLRALLKEHGLPSRNGHFLFGNPPFDEICRLAKELPAQLIVMPTHGRAGLDRIIEGSTAERVVQHAPCPVFVAREHGSHPQEFSSILVPVDFSPSSLQALEYAISFAETVAARLIVFHAVQFGWAFAGGEPGVYEVAPLRESARREAETQMESFVRSAKFRAVGYETLIHIGPPVGEICAFAEARQVDLIITATHGRTGFTHLVMGSVAEQIARHADRPVLVVPSHPEVRAAALNRKRQPSRTQPQPAKRQRSAIARPRLTKQKSKLAAHPFPERRKTNKFRESHAA